MKSAVVVGAGVAGLAAAKVLSETFDQVRIYEGSPPAQEHHLHVLLKSGQDSLEKIFPGVKKKLQESGCPLIDWALDTVWENQDGCFPRYHSSIKTLSMSRINLTDTLRKIIHEENVEFIQNRVSSLNELDGDLIVLAPGQNFPLKKFLGFGVGKEETFPIELTYRSYVFYQHELNMEGIGQYYFQIDPPNNCIGGVISPIEDGKVMVTLIEHEEEYSECLEYVNFLNKAKKMNSGKFVEILNDATPHSGPFHYRKKMIHRKKLNVKHMPKKVIVMGDALLSLNPVFGQGMSVSLHQAEILMKMLSDGTFSEERFNRRCQSMSNFPHRLSLLGSQKSGIGKSSLQVYMRACQNSAGLHHYFLKQLHSMRIFPGRDL